MELLCRVTDATGGGAAPPVDLAVEVEGRSHTVADLALALRRALPLAELSPGDGATLSLSDSATLSLGDGEPLDGSLLLAEVGLVSGVELLLGPSAPRAAPGGVTHRAPGGAARRDTRPASGLDLVVACGPDVGTRVSLVPGRHTLGRDPSCWLTLSDPRLARVEAELLVVADPVPGGADLAIVIGVGSEAAGEPLLVDGVVVDGPTAVVPGQLVRIGATTLRIEPAPVPAGGRRPPPGARSAPVPLGDVAFHRTPYFPDPVVARVVDPMGDIPERPEPVRFAWLAALAPLAMGVTMALLYSPRFLIITAFTPVLALAGWLDQRRRTSQRFGRGAARYQSRLAARRVEIAEARAAERRQRFASAPDLAELALRAERRSPDLWVRHRAAPDVLDLRLGLGFLPSAVQVRPETRGDETLRRELAEELAAGATLAQVPVTVSLVDAAVVALVGAPGDTTALATSLVLQAACLHSPEDVVLVAATGAERRMEPWLKWLPHTRAASSPLAGGHLAHTGAALHQLLRELLVVAEDRAANTDRTLDRRWPRLLAVIDQALQPDPALFARLAALAPAAGLSIVWLTSGTDRVPRQAVATVACRPAVTAEPSTLSYTDPDREDQPLTIERASARFAHRLAGVLAPVRDASSATASGALPRLVTLNQTLGVEQVTPAWVAGRWVASAGNALRAPVGLGPAGQLVLDLVAQGPHGLIGGTSGAGKSELLMSLVAGLVAWNPPTRLNLLFVDYKGGAGSDQFRHLPHTVGYVTNLDALLARRALVSLRAELTRRMTLLQGRAKDLAEMLERHPDEAPPSLVIVVDEFATLVKEVPEFVAGVVDIAQRGRSLGIHLLLATQRPSGAVNENILANTNLRIALRMLDGAESASVIGTTDAALIPTPLRGRAFARLGPGQLVPFQTAWTGAPRQIAAGPPPVIVRPFAAGSPLPVVAPEPTPAPDGPPPSAAAGPAGTQLDELLAAVSAAAGQLGLSRGRSPWLDELPERVPLPAAPTVAGQEEATRWPVAIGLVDDPAAQAQYPAVVDLASGGGLLVLGTGGSGRTTALRTLAVAATLGPSPELVSQGVTGDGPAHQIELAEGSAVTIIALDFASRELLALGALPQCALAAAGDDLEAVTRAIALLDRLLGQRRAALATAARDGSAAPTFSRVLLVIDDYGNLAQTFEGAGASSQLVGWLETLNRVIVDGRQVGIHTALSASRRAVVKPGVLAAVANRLVLRQSDPAGYADAGLPPSVTTDLDLSPGRGFLNGPNLAQVASLTCGRESGRASEAAALRQLAREVTAPAGCPLPELAVPALAIDAVLEADRAGGASPPWMVVIGPTDLGHQPVRLDLTHDNLTVLGDPRSGRSTALISVGLQLAGAGIEVWAVGPSGSPLGTLSVAHRCLLGRAPAVAAGLAELVAADDGTRRFLLIDDVDLLDEPVLDAALGALLARGLRWAASTTSLRGYSTCPLVQEMKKARTVLYLQPPGSREVQELTGVNPRLRPGLPSTPGRGVLVANRLPRVVQVARARGRQVVDPGPVSPSPAPDPPPA